MADKLPEIPPQLRFESGLGGQPPFRAEVDAPTLEKISKLRTEISKTSELFNSPDEKPMIAKLIADEYLQNPDTPDEVKMEAFRETVLLMGDSNEPAINQELALTALDILRWTPVNPALRIRMAAILASEIDDMVKGKEYEERRANDDVRVRRLTFFELLDNQDVDSFTKKYIANLLHPQSPLNIFKQLYEWESDLTITPRVTEELTDILDLEKVNTPIEDVDGKGLAASFLKLKPRYLPSIGKMAHYQEVNGEPLPVFIVWREGAQFVSVRFPPSLTKRAYELWRKFRNNEVDRGYVFKEAKKLQDEYMAMLPEDQRGELGDIGKTKNLEIRFATERGDSEAAASIAADQQLLERKTG